MCGGFQTIIESTVLDPYILQVLSKGILAIRRIFSLVDMITNTKFSNCADVYKIGVVQQ